MKLSRFRTLVAALALTSCGDGHTDAPPPADFVFLNGGVYTLESSTWAEAVAVRGNTIVRVGTNAEVRALVGEKTEVVDLTGRMLLPGFVDSHTHPMFGASRKGSTSSSTPKRRSPPGWRSMPPRTGRRRSSAATAGDTGPCPRRDR
jgi:imidazolonepropionase-like amidohydrolase